jgi:hypothetical protein
MKTQESTIQSNINNNCSVRNEEISFVLKVTTYFWKGTDTSPTRRSLDFHFPATVQIWNRKLSFLASVSSNLLNNTQHSSLLLSWIRRFSKYSQHTRQFWDHSIQVLDFWEDFLLNRTEGICIQSHSNIWIICLKWHKFLKMKSEC